MYATDIFSLAVGLAIAFFMFGAVGSAIWGGRVGVDGATAPFTFRDHRWRFIRIVGSYFGIGCIGALMAGRVILELWKDF